jgi:IclR family KDG regulon transcriptional repressor
MAMPVHIYERPVKLVKSASRVLDLFELLLEEPRGLTLSEISHRLEVPRSSAHGLIQTLLTRGYLHRAGDSGQRLRLGVRLIELGLSVSDEFDLRPVARQHLERLASETHETAFIAILDGGEFVCMDKFVSRDAETRVRADAPLGARRAIHCTSLGKAYLAALDDRSATEMLDKYGMRPATRHSLTSKAAMLKDLAATRARGYSVDSQEAVLGICCVGAPIRNHIGTPFAAVSVSMIRDFADPEVQGPAVMRAAVEISRTLGWNGDVATLYAS